MYLKRNAVLSQLPSHGVLCFTEWAGLEEGQVARGLAEQFLHLSLVPGQ